MMIADLSASTWFTQWNWQPTLILGTIAIIALYIFATGPLRVRYHLGPAVPTSRFVAFLAGVLIIFFSLFSPLDAIGDTYLFSGHMIQHMLLSLAAPPLLLLGIPEWFILPLQRNRLLLWLGTFVTMPLVASLLFNGNLWFWHAPPIYNATLVNEPLHEFAHLLYIATGVLFWWPILSPMRDRWAPLPLGGKLAYLFFSDMPMVLLGAGLTFTPPLYSRYTNAPRLFGLSPAVDQQLGGLIMWIVGSIFLIVLVSIFFIRWMYQQEERERAAVEQWAAEGEAEEEMADVSEQTLG